MTHCNAGEQSDVTAASTTFNGRKYGLASTVGTKMRDDREVRETRALDYVVCVYESERSKGKLFWFFEGCCIMY